MQIQGLLLTLLHHELDPQENVPEVQLIPVKRAGQLTGSQVLKTQKQHFNSDSDSGYSSLKGKHEASWEQAAVNE